MGGLLQSSRGNPERKIFAFLIRKRRVWFGRVPPTSGLEDEARAHLLRDRDLPDLAIVILMPDEWDGGPIKRPEDVSDPVIRAGMGPYIALALHHKGYSNEDAAGLIRAETEWHSVDMSDGKHILFYGVSTAELEEDASRAIEGAKRQSSAATAIVAFMLYPEDSLAADAAFVADRQPDSLAMELKIELSLPNAVVRIYPPEDWGPPPIRTKDDIYRDDILRPITGNAFRRVLADGVDDDLARGAFGDGSFETLILRESGRVILFQKLTGHPDQLGTLVSSK